MHAAVVLKTNAHFSDSLLLGIIRWHGPLYSILYCYIPMCIRYPHKFDVIDNEALISSTKESLKGERLKF